MIKVLIVDDSVVFRKVLEDALGRHPRVRVVGTAVNGKDAIRQIRRLRPHLLVLDVEMPEMNGLQTLDEIKRQRLDVGVIMFSTLTIEGASTTIEALSKGAFDFVPKPSGQGAFAESVKRIEKELLPKIEAYAASLRTKRTILQPPTKPTGVHPSTVRARKSPRPWSLPPTKGASTARTISSRYRTVTRIGFKPEAVAIGVSTGGPNALDQVIPKLPVNFRLPVFLVQHMPPVFTAQLAKRLNEKSKIKVVEAQHRQPVQPATVYVAPGDYHMTVQNSGNKKIIKLNQDPPVNSCRPAVDVLFSSVAKVYGPRTVAVIMTGMGQDGLHGCRELKAKGAFIIAQDKETSVVWGMPKFVTEEGLADKVCPLDNIASVILDAAGIKASAAAKLGNT